MKKLFLMLICCMMAVGAMAQKPIDVGFHLGYANSSNSFETKDFMSSIKDNGFSAGAFLRYNVKKFYVQPSVDYLFTKTKTSGSDVDVKMNYIQVPVMLGYTLFDAKLFSVRLFAGPEVDFLAKSGAKNLNTVTWSAKAGAGIDIGGITVDLNYRFALSKTGDEFGKSKGFDINVGFKVF